MALLFYALLLSDYGNRGQSLVYGIGFSFSMFCLITNISHEAAHGVLCRSPRLNSLIHSAVFSLSGVNARLWKLRHNAAHHPFPNVPSCDADVDHNPVLKLHPDNRHYAHFRFQHLYAPFAYIVGMLHAVIIQDIIYLRKNKLANLENIQSTWIDIVGFVTAKITYALVWIVLPWVILPYSNGHILFGCFLCSAFMALAFLPIICTHFCEECSLPSLDETGNLKGSSIAHQLAASMDFSTSSLLARFVYGGLNLHAAHHLYPWVSHAYYPAITQMIKHQTERYGLPYNQQTLCGVLCSHFRLLKTLGERSVNC